ncbi:sporulation protein YqfD [Thermobrachium celere]|uniref:sporulation protein YqfD n=1 Tax=Thermobrachium celere TaxID=53422 RepID=UPI0019405508|nr:sporulation protein YqfD [Thermobrachium celere]GFR34510.1 hypothetical protein TCEA9_03220 [Thermobrachium celere]
MALKLGLKKNKTNLREVENNILKEIKELSLINLSIDGIKLNVDVVERTMPPSIFNSDEPVDIVAKKDGIITKLYCYKGTPLVKVGDYVQKGQVLISGDIIYTNKETNKQEVIKTVHSLGKVYAKVWYEVFQEQELKLQKRTRTGKFIKNEYIILNGNKIYIKKFENNFLNYDKIENKTKVSILGYNIPVDKIEETIYEVDVENVDYTIDQAIKIATQKAQEEINKQIPKNVNLIDKKYDKIIEKNKVKVRLLYITEEEISYDQHR